MGYTSDKPQRFCEMFNEVALDAKLSETFYNAMVSKLVFIKSTGQVQVKLDLPCLVKLQLIYLLEKILSRFFNTSVSIIPCFKFEKSDKEFVDCCKDYFYQAIYRKSKHYGVLMKDADFEIDGNTLKIHLKTTCKAILQSGKCDEYLESFIKTCFNRNIMVEFIDPPIDDRLKAQYLKKKMELEKETIQKIISYSAENGDERNNVSASDSSYNVNQKSKSNNSDLVYGRDFARNDIVNMSDVSIDSGRVTVKGRVIRIETRLLKSGKTLFCFDITDLTHSITVKCFANDKQLTLLEENIKIGSWFMSMVTPSLILSVKN